MVLAGVPRAAHSSLNLHSLPTVLEESADTPAPARDLKPAAVGMLDRIMEPSISVTLKAALEDHVKAATGASLGADG